MRQLFTSLLLLCLSVSAPAQQSEDLIIMKNGNSYTGRIIKYQQGEELLLQQEDGTKITLADEGIDKIIQRVEIITPPDSKVFPSRPGPKPFVKPITRGLYHITQLSFAMGDGSDNGVAVGAGISTIIGRQFSPRFGLGFGIGFDNYARRGETIYPVFLNMHSYLPFDKKPNAYYLTLNAGYGFAFKREKIGITEAEGGWMALAAFGYRTHTKEGVEINIDVGPKFQKASFSRFLINGDLEVRDVLFKRLIFRAGITFWQKK